MKTACPYHTGEVHEWTDTSGFVGEVRRRVRGLDLLVILAVPAALVALHTLPMATRQALAFQYARPTLLTAYTSNFVHGSGSHLIGNLLAYLLVVPTAYLLSVLSNRRRHFRVFFFLVIGAFPFVISLTQLPFRNAGLGWGFSGLTMAFYGYTSLVLVGYLATRLTTALHLDHAPLVFFSQVGGIALLTVPLTAASIGIAGGMFLLVLVYLISLGRSLRESPGPVISREIGRAGYAETTGFTILVVAFFLVVGFTDRRVGGTTVSLLAHFVGFASGFLVSYIVLRTDCSLSHIYHCAGPDSDCELHDSPFTRLLRRLLLARLL